MIGNVFLLFLGIVLQVNVLASHLTLQLNSNQRTYINEREEFTLMVYFTLCLLYSYGLHDLVHRRASDTGDLASKRRIEWRAFVSHTTSVD